MAPLPLFLTAFVVGFSGAMMPGPVSAVTVVHSVQHGFWAGPQVTAGHALPEGLMVLVLAFGLGKALRQRTVMGIIGLGGAVVLGWMGYWLMIQGWQGGGEAIWGQNVPATAAGYLSPSVAGMVATLINPYWFLWWATVGGSYVALAQKTKQLGVPAFYSGHVLSDLSWNSLLSLAVGTGRSFFSAGVYRGLFFMCGLFLVGLAVYFLWTGVRHWRKR